jgi:hypothetical protein
LTSADKVASGIEKGCSLRLLFGAAVIGGLVALPFTAIWKPLGTAVGVAVFFVVMGYFIKTPTINVRCPYCRRSVRPDAKLCSRCGRTF